MAKLLREVADDEGPKLLLLLSGAGNGVSRSFRTAATTCRDREFRCKTCNKTFPTFQALGGHMTGHKRPRDEDADSSPAAKKAAAHQCPICGLVFPLGQALGGHMRRHKDVIGANNNAAIKHNKEDFVASPAAADSSDVSELLSGSTDARDAVDGCLLISKGASNSHSSSLGPASGSHLQYNSREGTASLDVDLELRLGRQAPPLRPRIAAFDKDSLFTALRLGIRA